MHEFVVTVTSEGRLTLPVDVRQHLGISGADRVVFCIDDKGVVTVRPNQPLDVDSLTGAAGSLNRSMGFHELLDIAREDALHEPKKERA